MQPALASYKVDLELHSVFKVCLHLRTLPDHRPHLVLGHKLQLICHVARTCLGP